MLAVDEDQEWKPLGHSSSTVFVLRRWRISSYPQSVVALPPTEWSYRRHRTRKTKVKRSLKTNVIKDFLVQLGVLPSTVVRSGTFTGTMRHVADDILRRSLLNCRLA